jgi:hypothetical protein
MGCNDYLCNGGSHGLHSCMHSVKEFLKICTPRIMGWQGGKKRGRRRSRRMGILCAHAHHAEGACCSTAVGCKLNEVLDTERTPKQLCAQLAETSCPFLLIKSEGLQKWLHCAVQTCTLSLIQSMPVSLARLLRGKQKR